VRPAARLLAALCAAAVLLAGCGSSGKTELKVSAAASLRKALDQYGGSLRGYSASFSFAGSDALAAQIEQGVRPDIFASANTKLPDALYAKGLLEKPVVFAANKLVIAVPSKSRITSIADLEKKGVTVSVGTATVPVGDYTTKVLARLPARERRLLEANIRDRESDVTGIVGKLSEQAVDAGFLYATDVKAAGGALKAIDLPASLQPRVAYGIAVVRGTGHAAQARSFISGLLGGTGRSELLGAGFLPPPAG
jgi:molybdate transport system substrate-binding protein